VTVSVSSYKNSRKNFGVKQTERHDDDRYRN